ncbi:MAG: YjbE family putative metal transport protein [Phenylobacterium sp.]|uniref:YjbE family putative metal transport protein n=1 Tax=Phenylobacterium sp. TaxID=1871053 RepID=UPI0025E3CF7D|nr:YjbE family putative metal transport protein [Phenylobacterium sp.]MBI1196295.1 YjbE family putative metal transport protein [Phenylobacterium sp.]
MLEGLIAAGAASALVQVLLIDLVLAGDNAVAVGLAAAGLPPEQRRKAILLGMAVAVIARIGFALITTQLLDVLGLLLAGGVLLLWVCWKMWRDLREHAQEPALAGDGAAPPPRAPKSFGRALATIAIADISMSLDNVLAVAGAAREHPGVLVAGLLISIALMGAAAHAIARLLDRHRWLGYLGLAIVAYVALHMIWEGHRELVVDLGRGPAYNAVMPAALDLTPRELAGGG